MIFLKHELVLLVKQLTEDQNEDKKCTKEAAGEDGSF